MKPTTNPDLCEYETANSIREATDQERAESIDAARSDGGAGVIQVNGVDCYVQCGADDKEFMKGQEQPS